jgi:hypothetical protein
MKTKKDMVIIFPFRSFHNQKINLKTSSFLFFPIAFNLLILHYINYITLFWGTVLEYFLPRLGYSGDIIYSKYSLFQVDFLLPAINIEANLPSVTTWCATVFLTLGVFLLTSLLRDAYTPLKYLLRTFLILIWITQIYILYFPDGFMYNIFFFTKSGFMQILSLLFVIPWIFLMSFYFFGYRFINKIIITLLTFLYFIILAPFQYLLNACLINLFSLMMMPPLFFFSGLAINILAIIAFCTYGVSKVPMHSKYKRRR